MLNGSPTCAAPVTLWTCATPNSLTLVSWRPYGIEATLRDDSGNLISLTQAFAFGVPTD